MMKVFDTNILIDYLNGHAQARNVVLEKSNTAISVVTWSELLVGCTTAVEKRRMTDFIHRYLQVVSANMVIGEIAADIRRQGRLKSLRVLFPASWGVIARSIATKQSRKDWIATLTLFARNDGYTQYPAACGGVVYFPYALH